MKPHQLQINQIICKQTTLFANSLQSLFSTPFSFLSTFGMKLSKLKNIYDYPSQKKLKTLRQTGNGLGVTCFQKPNSQLNWTDIVRFKPYYSGITVWSKRSYFLDTIECQSAVSPSWQALQLICSECGLFAINVVWLQIMWFHLQIMWF